MELDAQVPARIDRAEDPLAAPRLHQRAAPEQVVPLVGRAVVAQEPRRQEQHVIERQQAQEPLRQPRARTLQRLAGDHPLRQRVVERQATEREEDGEEHVEVADHDPRQRVVAVGMQADIARGLLPRVEQHHGHHHQAQRVELGDSPAAAARRSRGAHASPARGAPMRGSRPRTARSPRAPGSAAGHATAPGRAACRSPGSHPRAPRPSSHRRAAARSAQRSSRR